MIKALFNKNTALAAVAILALSGGAMAESAKTHKTDMAKKKVSELTCEDFNALEESFKPTVVGWVVGFNKKGEEDDAVIDVDGIETVTPAIIEACKQEPKASFWKKAEAELKKVF
ncbi:acid-resistance protein [Brucella sp. 10RB9215]|uniref:Probable acid stress chaperone HdeA n=1 Tax=Brucella inopinata TaxID=1218315 RepID=A0AAW7B7A9_9HYPH|nr:MULTISPECIES: acid-activated periplasmic chaperone HdeA [Brucella]EFM55784.1 acid-resistance protein [Brucella inopinata BO1]KEY03738.1 chaperone hdeA [Brucella suis bv. 4 str. 40]MDL2331909.1 acid-activated periplasmic chaperone HdeA [Brucella inopinata]SBW15522.1 acid-resistance protein [Brucella sp. 10RB9215]